MPSTKNVHATFMLIFKIMDLEFETIALLETSCTSPIITMHMELFLCISNCTFTNIGDVIFNVFGTTMVMFNALIVKHILSMLLCGSL